MFYLL